MPKKMSLSTYERLMRDPKRKARFEDKYAQFLLSEILLGLMEQERISVRALAQKVGVSAAVIQDIRSGKRSNITVRNLLRIAASLGAEVQIVKGKKSYVLMGD